MVIGDVSGKGIPAALFMAVTTTLLRVAACDQERPEEILLRVSDALTAHNPAHVRHPLLCRFSAQGRQVTCQHGAPFSRACPSGQCASLCRSPRAAWWQASCREWTSPARLSTFNPETLWSSTRMESPKPSTCRGSSSARRPPRTVGEGGAERGRNGGRTSKRFAVMRGSIRSPMTLPSWPCVGRREAVERPRRLVSESACQAPASAVDHAEPGTAPTAASFLSSQDPLCCAHGAARSFPSIPQNYFKRSPCRSRKGEQKCCFQASSAPVPSKMT